MASSAFPSPEGGERTTPENFLVDFTTSVCTSCCHQLRRVHHPRVPDTILKTSAHRRCHHCLAPPFTSRQVSLGHYAELDKNGPAGSPVSQRLSMHRMNRKGDDASSVAAGVPRAFQTRLPAPDIYYAIAGQMSHLPQWGLSRWWAAIAVFCER